MTTTLEELITEKEYLVKDESRPQLKWYAVEVTSNCEGKVTERIKEAVKMKDMADKIVDVLNPCFETIENKMGKKRKVTQRPYAGYIFIFANMDADVSQLILNIDKVKKMPGSKIMGRTLPLPMPSFEIKKVIDNLKMKQREEEKKSDFEVDNKVIIKDQSSPFSEMVGRIVKVNQDKEQLKIAVTIFGRETEIDFPFSAVANIT